MRTNLQQLIGGATEETIIARVGESIISSIGSAESHQRVLENPDMISRTVLQRGLDAQTAFQIVSIDIADIDVGDNIGARLRADQAEADVRVARALAEQRRRGHCHRAGESGIVAENRPIWCWRRPRCRGHGPGFKKGNLARSATEWPMTQLRAVNASRSRAEPGTNWLASLISPSVAQGLIVFTACFTCTKDLKLIVRISRGLAERGYGLLRYDLTGLGNSTGDFAQSNFSSGRTDLMAAVHWVRDQYAAPAFLIGHSLGGAISLSTAQQLSSIVGVASLAAPSDTQHLAALLQRMNSAVEQTGAATVSIGGVRHTITRQLLEDLRRFQLPDQLRQLSKPVLLMHSPEDETLGFQHALRLYQYLTVRQTGDAPACPTSLICLAGANHLLTNNPADLTFVIQLLAAWLDRQLAGPHVARH